MVIFGTDGWKLDYCDAYWCCCGIVHTVFEDFFSSGICIYGTRQHCSGNTVVLDGCVRGPLNIRLLSYKGQELEFMKRFKEYSRLNFSIFENVEDLITGADVVVSCVTVAHGQFASDTCFKPGVLVVPVHTRGFQNCDLFFDQIFADDVAHVEGFKYFNQFKQFDEFARILLKQNPGRTSDQEAYFGL